MNLPAVIDNSQRNIEIWRASTDAASLCKEVVIKRAIKLQGKRYVPVEGWQAIALAHGCVASAENVHPAEGGIAAEGVIRRMADGVEIARAEGFVGDDEKTWASRPMFARRGMAQTRAISRACRSAFAHVVVMMDVGLETTPYEEMQGVYDQGGAQPMSEAKPGAMTRQEAYDQPSLAIPEAIPEASESLRQLRRTLAECTSEQECKAWLKKQIDAINMLDEDERGPLEREYVALKAGFAEVSMIAA
jgi:hypothetical protein